ncbi:NAD-dependent epimerase/dehydratase family protein [Mucilaginibacter sp.]
MDQLQEDLDHILLYTKPLWDVIKGKTIFVTGGTGFFGKWILQSFNYINNVLSLNNKLIVLTRNSELFLLKNPQFKAMNNVDFINGDVRNFDFPSDPIDYIIHAATEASVSLNITQPMLMYDTIVEGTKRILELGRVKNVKGILHTSSGAVYGIQPANITNITEEFTGAPNIYAVNAAYGEGKRVAEMLAIMYEQKFQLKSKIARCYAFIGPYLPLDGTFAAGNFVKCVLDKKNIVVNGDGTPYRSYLYSSDLTIWLWTILFKAPSSRAYNVGSDKYLTIKDLANLVADFNTNKDVIITVPTTKNSEVQWYVPSIERAKKELGLSVNISLKEAIQKTIKYYSSVDN